MLSNMRIEKKDSTSSVFCEILNELLTYINMFSSNDSKIMESSIYSVELCEIMNIRKGQHFIKKIAKKFNFTLTLICRNFISLIGVQSKKFF